VTPGSFLTQSDVTRLERLEGRFDVWKRWGWKVASVVLLSVVLTATVARSHYEAAAVREATDFVSAGDIVGEPNFAARYTGRQAMIHDRGVVLILLCFAFVPGLVVFLLLIWAIHGYAVSVFRTVRLLQTEVSGFACSSPAKCGRLSSVPPFCLWAWG